MFNSIFLDVLIGLATIYLMLSLVVTSINEAISSFFSWRAYILESAIIGLLDGTARSKKKPTETATKTVTESSTETSKEPAKKRCWYHRVGLFLSARSMYPEEIGGFAEKFFNHPLLQSLVQSESSRPSYIPQEVFSAVVVDMIVHESPNQPTSTPATANAQLDAIRAWVREGIPRVGLPPNPQDPLISSLRLFLSEADAAVSDGTADAAQKRLEALRARMEVWFNGAMDRAAGWYKRHVQYSLFILGLGVAIIINVDSISISKALYSQPATREALKSLGTQYVTSHSTTQPSLTATPPSPSTTQPSQTTTQSSETTTQPTTAPADVSTSQPAMSEIDQLKGLVKTSQQLDLPIGWDHPTEFPTIDKFESNSEFTWKAFWAYFWQNPVPRFLVLVGWLTSAFAISLGAPFWFDTLNRLINIRGSGAAAATAGGPQPPPPPPTDGSGGASGGPKGPGGPSGGPVTKTRPKLVPDYWGSPARANDLVGLPPFAAPFNQRNALLAARLAKMAYFDESKIQGILRVWGGSMKLKKFFNDIPSGTQAFVAHTNDLVVVAFRGTESKLQDILADANLALRPSPDLIPTGRVHEGFNVALTAVLGDLRTLVTTLLKANPEAKLLVTGHSLGAALATLFAANITQHDNGAYQNRTLLTTFGSPRVGDLAFATWLNQALQTHLTNDHSRAYRFVNNEDIVTRVAPRALSYEHVGTVWYFDDKGVLEKGTTGWARFLNTVIHAAENFRQLPADAASDHTMDLYLALLENNQA